MEDLLHQINKEATAVKYLSLRKSCQEAVESLGDNSILEPYQLREKCLVPLQIALESRDRKLASYAICGIQTLLTDDRFQSSLECEDNESWLPMQVLTAVAVTPTLPEEIQVEVMKMLLNMAVSTAWCMNARVITKISELLLATLVNTTKQGVRNLVINALFRILEVVFQRHSMPRPNSPDPVSKVVLDAYGASGHCSIRTAVKATLTQLLTAIVEKLSEVQAKRDDEAATSAIADFTAADHQGEAESLCKDVVGILKYLCDKLYAAQHSNNSRQTEPLLLEGVYAILSKLPTSLRDNQELVDLIWQQLCPMLISILGNPLTDKSVTSQKSLSQDEVGRGSGCSTAAPSVHSMSAKTIYSIAVELVRLVGCFQTLRPVLESVFHRMLLYPPPVHRYEALKACKELLNDPERLLDLAGPTIQDPSAKPTPGGAAGMSARKKQDTELSLLKLIVDSIQECCHCNDSLVCITSVNLMNDLLTSVEQLVKGHGLSLDVIQLILIDYSTEVHSGDTHGTATHSDDSSDQSDVEGSSDEESGEATETSKQVDDQVPEVVDHQVDPQKAEAAKEVPHKLHHDSELKDKYGLRGVSNRTRDFDAAERCSAQQFVKQLSKFLPKELSSLSVVEVDENLQKFSSDVCTELSEKPDGSLGAILNADGVYLATYSALLFNLKLIECGYYESEEKSLPMAEQQFVDDILSTDLLVYLSRTWLSEVFHQVIQQNLLEEAGYVHQPRAYTEYALVELLTDIDGLESRKIGGQLLCAFRDAESLSEPSDVLGQPVPEVEKMAVEAGLKFARKTLSVCWEGILDVLSILINGKSSCGITSSLTLMFNAKEESRKAREAICTSLEGLQKAARLSCILGLQDRCGAVFEQLASASCVMELEDIKRERERQPDKKPAIPAAVAALTSRPKLARLHAAHCLSMDIVLSIGLEMGSHAGDCWQHVFRCCAHISELEHTYFSRGNNQSSLPKVQQEQPTMDAMTTGVASLGDPTLYSSMMVCHEPVAPTIKVNEIIHQSSIEAGWDSSISGGGVLSAAQASKVLCGLSQEVDRLYEDAAYKLNMKAFVTYLRELCKSSRHQLSTYGKLHSDGAGAATPAGSVPTNALHLYRLGDVMLKCLRSGRPFLHIMRAWSIVAPHFVEAACHRDRSISKKAVQCIHEVVTTMLGSQPELPHFHFNESLCKPFENLLCLELCDGDVQDQIVCSICELVEACTTEIKSGWRPLFGALRAVKIEYTTNEEVNEARQRHVAAVLDVFDVFLNTDNVLVFSNAAVDCILCLLKYVRGPGEFEVVQDDDSDSGSDFPSPASSEDLILPALKYLQQCCSMLGSMWQMPACPIFSGAHRIKEDGPKVVDPIIPNMNLEAFRKPFLASSSSGESLGDNSSDTADQTEAKDLPADRQETKADYDKGGDSKSLNSVDSGIGTNTSDNLSSTVRSSPIKEVEYSKRADDNASISATITSSPPESGVNQKRNPFGSPGEARKSEYHITYKSQCLKELDNHTGVLHVWYLVLEGLVSTVAACPKNYQPQTLEMLFNMMRSAAQVPGANFCLHLVNHLLLPMMQSWLRRGNQLSGYWDPGTTANFKQYVGLCTDLVVEYIIQFTSVAGQKSEVEFMLQQQLNVLSECIAQPIESLSRLGCACIRHCLLSCGPMLTEHMWQITTECLHHTFNVSLYCIRLLMTPFHANSDNFYGDIGQVKVAVRKDCSGLECERLRQLAQQVFLLDSQRGTSTIIDYEVEEDRSYIFLIYPPQTDEHASDQPIARVPFRSIVVGLLAHQILVQTVGCLLIQGSPNMVPSERSMMPSSPRCSRSSSLDHDDKTDSLIQDRHLPGMLKYMSSRNILKLLQCLYQSYHTATEFDARPGLKFLVQKVARADVAANMYKQAAVSSIFYIHTLLEICAHQDNVCVENTKQMLLDGASLVHAADSADAMEHVADAAESGPAIKSGAAAPDPRLLQAELSAHGPQRHMIVFVNKLKEMFDEVCTNYVDLYLDKEGPNAADRLSGQMLVFLLAQPEDIPTLKRDKSLKEMVTEKLQAMQRKSSQGAAEQTPATTSVDGAEATGDVFTEAPNSVSGALPLQPVPVQDMPAMSIEESPTKSTSGAESPGKDKLKKHSEDKVYTVATDKTIKSLMTEYKKRKQTNSMPTFVKATRSKPAPPRREQGSNGDATEHEIEQQQQSSIMRDSEAHLSSWIEMICNILQLFHQLPDLQYRALLPLVFNCVSQLICHCKDGRLREVLAQWTHRIGHIYGFAPSGDLPPK